MIVDDEGFSGTRTAQVVGITYRQLDYWARTDLDPPVAGRRHRERQSSPLLLPRPARAEGDQEAARRRHQLESVREVFDYLREHWIPTSPRPTS